MPDIKHISDFPDKINPVLVKELRQGLRGMSFVILFIAVQAFLALILLTTAAAASYDNAGHLISRIIFFFFSIAVLVVQPLRGIGSLHNEIKGKTIDLLCLTRLSSWRITYGKWVSIVSQSALILTAVIPYLILRYFFGDMQMFTEILLLLTIFALSALITSLNIGFSATDAVIIRVLLPIAIAFFTFMVICGVFADDRHSFQEALSLVSLSSASSTMVYLGIMTALAYSTWMLLDIGTSMIAPMAENRATVRRFVSLILITATVITLGLSREYYAAWIIGLLLCIPIMMISVTEQAELVPPITAPFVRKGILGKALGRLLYPGWATGMIFAFLLYGIMHALLVWLDSRGADFDTLPQTIVNSAFAMVFLAVTLTRLFVRKHPGRFGLLLLFMISQVLVIGIIFSCEEWSRDLEIMQFFFWIPASAPFLVARSGFSDTSLLNASYVNVIAYAAIALFTSVPVWKHIRETEGRSM